MDLELVKPLNDLYDIKRVQLNLKEVDIETSKNNYGLNHRPWPNGAKILTNRGSNQNDISCFFILIIDFLNLQKERGFSP